MREVRLATAIHDTARRLLQSLDLTDLSDSPSDAATERLAARAVTGPGHVAALCIWPQFVRIAKAALAGVPVRIATVANFPSGAEDERAVLGGIARALADGADEIDAVMNFRAFLAGETKAAERQLRAVRAAVPEPTILKVILETGKLETSAHIAEASRLAIACGADMLKTSTGKAAVSATPEAAEVMLTVIRDTSATVGFKAAGGIRTPAAGATYLAMAERILGRGWATPARFRIGVSGLLDELLKLLDG